MKRLRTKEKKILRALKETQMVVAQKQLKEKKPRSKKEKQERKSRKSNSKNRAESATKP